MREKIKAKLVLEYENYEDTIALTVRLTGEDYPSQAIVWGWKRRGTREGGPSDPGWVDAEAAAHGLEMLAKWIRSKLPRKADLRALL